MKVEFTARELSTFLQLALREQVSAVEIRPHALLQEVEVRLAGLKAAAGYLDWMDTDTLGVHVKPVAVVGTPRLCLRLNDVQIRAGSAAQQEASRRLGDPLSRLIKRLLRGGANMAIDWNWVRSRILAGIPRRDWLAFDSERREITLDLALAFRLQRFALALRSVRVESGGLLLDADFQPAGPAATAGPQAAVG